MLKSAGSGGASVTFPSARNRIALIGDSHNAFGYATRNIATTAGKFVVSGGIATIVVTGNHNSGTGNLVYLSNLGEPSFANPLNGVCATILSAIDNNTFTISATFNNQTLADGDYSNYTGTAWVAAFLSTKTDSALFNWINWYLKGYFVVTNLNCAVNQTAAGQVRLIDKLLAGPAFDIGVISLGTNDFQTSPVAVAMAAMYKASDDIKTIADALIRRRKLGWIMNGNADNIGNSNSLPKAQAFGVMRQLLIDYAALNPEVRIIDTFAETIDGTVATGVPRANVINAGDNHMSTYGDIQVARNLAPTFATAMILPDKQPVALFEDNRTYAQLATAWVGSTSYPTVGTTVRNGLAMYRLITAGVSASSGGPTGTGSAITDGTCVWRYIAIHAHNIIPHGLMDGTTGNNATAGAWTGNVPTGWTLQNSGGSGTSTPNAARTAIGTTQSASWGKGWQLSNVFTDVDQYVQVAFDIFPGIVKGYWYRYGMTLTPLNAWANNVKGIEFYIACGGGAAFFQPTVITAGNNRNFYPLALNEPWQFVSDPIFISSTNTFTDATFIFRLIAAGAATVNFELASAFMHAVESPA